MVAYSTKWLQFFDMRNECWFLFGYICCPYTKPFFFFLKQCLSGLHMCSAYVHTNPLFCQALSSLTIWNIWCSKLKSGSWDPHSLQHFKEQSNHPFYDYVALWIIATGKQYHLKIVGKKEIQLHDLGSDWRPNLLNLASDLASKSRAQCLTNVNGLLIIAISSIAMLLRESVMCTGEVKLSGLEVWWRRYMSTKLVTQWQLFPILRWLSEEIFMLFTMPMVLSRHTCTASHLHIYLV